MIYSVDTSALLDGWRRYYPPDVFPTIWEKIDELIAAGELRATEEVRVELERKDDDVFRWAKAQAGLFVPIDEDIQVEVSGILRDYPRLVDQRKGRSGADPFVVALARCQRATVVTGEQRSQKATKIPNVCDALGIRCIGLLEFFREKSWKL